MTNYKINELLGAIPFPKQSHKNSLKFFIAKNKFCYNVGAFNVFDTMEGGIIKIRACLRHLMALVVHETMVLITPTLENAVQAW